MFRIFIAFTALFLTTAAHAQSFPAIFRVTDVRAGDVLNIRAEPSSQAPILGSFHRFETGIEVVGLSEDRRWGLVRVGDAMGWSFMRYLAAQRADSWRDGQQEMTCFGTEPFWTVNLFLPSNRAEFHDATTGGYEVRTDAPNLPSTPHPATLAVPFYGARDGVAVIRQGVCSDGMSDRVYGLETQIYFRRDPAGLSGCCSLSN